MQRSSFAPEGVGNGAIVCASGDCAKDVLVLDGFAGKSRSRLTAVFGRRDARDPDRSYYVDLSLLLGSDQTSKPTAVGVESNPYDTYSAVRREFLCAFVGQRSALPARRITLRSTTHMPMFALNWVEIEHASDKLPLPRFDNCDRPVPVGWSATLPEPFRHLR